MHAPARTHTHTYTYTHNGTRQKWMNGGLEVNDTLMQKNCNFKQFNFIYIIYTHQFKFIYVYKFKLVNMKF